LLQVAELVVEDQTKDQLMTVLLVVAMYRELAIPEPLLGRLDLDMVEATAGGMALVVADGLAATARMVATQPEAAVMLLRAPL
jgi:hypothetical protein